MTRRILIIHNPTAGKRRTALLNGVVAALCARGLAPEVVTTEWPEHATDLALSADADLVVAAGGDGTINEVVHGLMTRDCARPAFATLPLGTINVLALELGLPRDVVGLAGVLADGPLMPVTVGRANGLHFLLTAGAGADAAAVKFLSPGLKKIFGQTAYYIALVRALIVEGNTVFDVEIDGAMYPVSSVIVTNAARYAGDKVVAPDARLTAPDLHVLIGLGHGRWNLMRYGAAYMRGVLPGLPDVRIVPVQRLRIAAPAGKPVQLDGDNRLTTPVDIEVVDEPLMVASVSQMNGAGTTDLVFEARHQCVVELFTGAQDVVVVDVFAVVGDAGAVDVGDAAAGFFDDEVGGGDVPFAFVARRYGGVEAAIGDDGHAVGH